MSLSFETSRSQEDLVETSDETFAFVAWYSDDQQRVTTPMPELSQATKERLGTILDEDPDLGVYGAIGNLVNVDDERLKQAIFLYVCGYSNSDLEMAFPDIKIANIEAIVDEWKPPVEIHSENLVTHALVHHHLDTVSEPRSANVIRVRQIGHSASTTFVQEPKKSMSPRAQKEKTILFDEDEPDSEKVKSKMDDGFQDIDSVGLYKNQIGKVALLNAIQEVELAKNIEAGLYAEKLLEASRSGEVISTPRGDVLPRELSVPERRNMQRIVNQGEASQSHLVEANLRWVMALAKRYTGRGMDYQDLIQEGNLGLIQTMKKFDYTKGYKFSTYATWWIRQSISRGMADQARTIRLPVHMVEQVNKLARIKRELHQTLGREATYEELSEESGIEIEKIGDLLERARLPISLDKSVSDDGEAPLADFIADTDGILPDEVVEHSVMTEKMGEDIKSALMVLDGREREVIEWRLGLRDGKPKTLDQIGDKLGVTRERIRQLESKALSMLRHPSNGAKVGLLRQYLDL